jgi:hypothetical protein
MRLRDNKPVFEVKFTWDKSVYNKVIRFLKKRNMKKSQFCKTAMIKEIKSILEKEKQNGQA